MKDFIWNAKKQMPIRGIIFLFLFFIMLALTTVLFKPKWYHEGAAWEAATMIEDGMYAEEKNTIDVAYLGSSHAFRGINPLIIWKEHNLTGYVYGSSIQRMWISEYYLKELMKNQTPKVVVLEIFGILYETSNNEDRNRKALDYMNFSKDKIKAIIESIPEDKSENFLSYIFPIMRYHSRWNQLEKKDFSYFRAPKKYYLKGWDPVFDRYEQEEISFQDTENTSINIDQKVKKHLDNIVKLCKDNGIELVLLKTPTHEWTKGYSKTILNYALENGIDFIDYHTYYKKIGISEQTDFHDPAHLNVFGSEKLSKDLGNYISTNYLPEYTNEYVDKKLWNQDYAKYSQLKLANELSTETSLSNYISKLKNNPNYLIAISANGNSDVDISMAIPHVELLGLTELKRKEIGECYLALIRSEELLFENRSKDPIKYRNKIHKIPFELSSQSVNEGSMSSVVIDRIEYSKNQRGINLVVYDMLLDRVIDSCYFNNGEWVMR